MATLQLDRLDELPDDEVIAELVAVKGLGAWSAHMFLMFHLQRPDVVAVGDLGIRKAIKVRYGFAGLPVTRRGHHPRRKMASVPHPGVSVPVAFAHATP